MAIASIVSNSVRQDPAVHFAFQVYTDDRTTIPMGEVGFESVSGLKANTEVIEYKEGNEVRKRKLPGQSTAENITLARGIDGKGYLQAWYNLVREDRYKTVGGQPNPDIRRTLIIVVKSRGQSEDLKVWYAIGAWPCSYQSGDLTTDGDDVLLETVEICCEDLYQHSPAV